MDSVYGSELVALAPLINCPYPLSAHGRRVKGINPAKALSSPANSWLFGILVVIARAPYSDVNQFESSVRHSMAYAPLESVGKGRRFESVDSGESEEFVLSGTIFVLYCTL